jgi:hypothetical protein
MKKQSLIEFKQELETLAKDNQGDENFIEVVSYFLDRVDEEIAYAEDNKENLSV